MPECQERCDCGNVCGLTDGHVIHLCPRCKSEWEEPVFDPGTDIEEGFADDSICEACEGTGMVGGRLCKDCGGKIYK